MQTDLDSSNCYFFFYLNKGALYYLVTSLSSNVTTVTEPHSLAPEGTSLDQPVLVFHSEMIEKTTNKVCCSFIMSWEHDGTKCAAADMRYARSTVPYMRSCLWCITTSFRAQDDMKESQTDHPCYSEHRGLFTSSSHFWTLELDEQLFFQVPIQLISVIYHTSFDLN